MKTQTVLVDEDTDRVIMKFQRPGRRVRLSTRRTRQPGFRPGDYEKRMAEDIILPHMKTNPLKTYTTEEIRAVVEAVSGQRHIGGTITYLRKFQGLIESPKKGHYKLTQKAFA